MKKSKSKPPLTRASSNDTPGPFVVGIGASAGGVQALRIFFEKVPVDSGMAYVVILHLSPDHDSKLTEVIQQTTTIPVKKVTSKTSIEADHIYVVPPNKHLTIDKGTIVPNTNMMEEDRRAPVDIFFRSLAQWYGSRAICVVLSGNGANGSMGLKKVKENGGVAFVQNPREAEYNEMPRNSIATDMVDDVLSVAEIPARIMAYRQNIGTVRIPVESEKRADDDQLALREIFTHLRLRTGHDFSNYKRPTLLRRIERRINVRNFPDLPSYAAFVVKHPDEVTLLLKDLLISVTNFFRDKKVFELLENEIIPKILSGKQPGEQARVWVVGCATGEEAYSIAMLFAEKTLGALDAPKIQVFATDIDDTAIALAREGLYTLNDAADVSPERLRRFFNKEGESYRIRRELREMVLFANHNFLKDPPFSRLDLISCRNVLIYLNPQAQERVMETFHFALNQGAYLLVGLSESVETANDIYTPFNRELHIFQPREVSIRTFPVPDSVPSVQLKDRSPHQGLVAIEKESGRERITVGDLHQRLLEQYAPPSIVVNLDYDVVHLSERAGKYLQITGGEPTQNLLRMIRQELRLELRAALYQAVQRQAPVDAKGLKVKIGDAAEIVDVHVRPVLREGDSAYGLILVVFEQTSSANSETTVLLTSDEPVAQQLEEELMRVKLQLRGSIEQHEYQAEELKASNEELQAMNEELRSSAEELETSKEELQSINEELRTLNQELKVKVEETTLASNNLQNLINSAEIATIFLDRGLRVVLFTPTASQLFNLIRNDIGRLLSDITHRLLDPDIISDSETVLKNLKTIEREIKSTDNQVYLMRALPYRTEHDRVNGVVITFFNITERKKSEISLRESAERFRAMISQSTAGVVQMDLGGRFTLVNRKFCGIVGYNESELLNMKMVDLVHEDDGKQNQALLSQLGTQGLPFDAEQRLVCKDGSLRWVTVSVSAIRNQEGKSEAAVAVYHDITERKALEQQKDEFIGIASHELKTPLTSIKSYAEIVLETLQKSKDNKAVALMQKLNSQIDRLTGLVRDLLDTTKITDGKLVLSFEKFNINKLVEEQLEEMKRLSDKHDLIHKAGILKPVEGDRERIGQVLTNLVTNAIKYSPSGGKVIISTENKGNHLLVSVADKGIGIADKYKERVFDRFFRISNAELKTFPGMGLGLYISSIIIQRHGGTIDVKSKPGKGAVFRFTLPYKQPNR
jgi:two-component system CheB/CheR fusion protein